MTKREIIQHLRAAKSGHIKWRSYAQALVAGLPMDEGKIPVIHTDCKFGKWYYGNGQVLSSLESFHAIEEPHEMLHSIYHNLVKALYASEEKGFFSRFVDTGRSENERKDDASRHLNSLIEMSKTLLESIEILEKEVLSMEDDEVMALI
jgi:hypothetical protein